MQLTTKRHRQALSEYLPAISHPLRQDLLLLLSKYGPLHVNQIVQRLGEKQSKVSHHLGILRHARMVVGIPDSREVLYRLVEDDEGGTVRKIIELLAGPKHD